MWFLFFFFLILPFFFLVAKILDQYSLLSRLMKKTIILIVKWFTGCNPDKYPNYSRFIFQSHAPRLVSSRICKRKCVHVTVTSQGSIKRAIGGGLLDFQNFILCSVYLMINLSKIIL